LCDDGVWVRGQVAVADQLDLAQRLLTSLLALVSQWLVLDFGRNVGNLVEEAKLTLEKFFLGSCQVVFDRFDYGLEQVAYLRVFYFGILVPVHISGQIPYELVS
jgi:hypothetical protein